MILGHGFSRIYTDNEDERFSFARVLIRENPCDPWLVLICLIS